MTSETDDAQPKVPNPVEETFDEDVAVQGTEPDDRQDAAVALGTAPPHKTDGATFVGGGEVDWASLERDRAKGSE